MSERQAGEEFRDLFENAPCGYVTLGPNGRVSRVNATMKTWIGFSDAELTGKRLHEFLNIAGRIYFETHIAPLLRMQGSFSEVALDFVMKDGGKLPVIMNAAEQRDADGNAMLTRVVVLKATDRRLYERNLIETRSAAQEGLRSERATSELREQFIAVLGHDLRNPLASISAGVRILQRSDSPKSDADFQVLAMLNTTVARMAGLIDDVLDFARGRLGGGITLTRDAQRPLEPVLLQVVDELRIAHPTREIRTEFAISESVDCDRSRMGQLVSNLVGNALTHGAVHSPVRVYARTVSGTFELSVTNAGEAIPEAAMARLFEPFFRGEARDSGHGLGLGLHIASQIAQAHGGRLSVTSTPEQTRFVLTMPHSNQNNLASHSVDQE
jgi:sigma-B regulation protein RsbU (phosphoserine phosphatase)